jgi:hypothetical protein
LASYRVSDNVSFAAGIANTINSGINSRATSGSSGIVGGPLQSVWNGLLSGAGAVAGVPVVPTTGANARSESYKSYMGSVAFTAPDSMGFLSGSTFYAGAVSGYNNSVLGSGLGNSSWNAYVGATLATPVAGLRLGAAFDYLGSEGQNNAWLTSDPFGTPTAADLRFEVNAYAPALYLSYQATDKLSLHARGEYFQGDIEARSTVLGFNQNASLKLWAFTATAQYDLWKNVLSRVEFRWDHTEHGNAFGGVDPITGGPNRANAFMLAANVIYKF